MTRWASSHYAAERWARLTVSFVRAFRVYIKFDVDRFRDTFDSPERMATRRELDRIRGMA